MHCWRHKTPIIYRATSQWFAGMDVKPNDTGKTLRETALEGIEATALLSGVGQAAPVQHDRQPSGLDAVAPAPVGRADGVLRAQGNRRTASAHAGAARRSRASASRRPASKRGKRSTPSELTRRRRQHVREEPRHARRLVRLGHDALARAARLAQGRAAIPGRPVSGRLGPASRLVPFVAADRVDARRPPAVQRAAHARLHRRRRRPQDEQVARQRHRSARSGRTASARKSSACGSRRPTIRANCRSPTKS